VFIGENAIIGAIFLDSVFVLLAELFIELFADNGFMCIGRLLEVQKDEPSSDINKECVSRVMMKGPMTMHCVREAKTASNHLVDTAHFAWSKWSLTNWLEFLKGMLFGLPYWHLQHKGGEQ